MKNLKNLRKARKRTQKDLAKITGYQQTLISKWEQGEREPSIDALIKISNYLNVSIDELVGNQNQDFQPIEIEPIIPDYQQEVIDLVLKLNSRQCSRLCGYIERQFEETTYKTKEN